jgi:hypothetical protein
VTGYAIGGARAREICERGAKSADEAIKRTIREYDISEADKKRLAAYQVIRV